MGTKTCNQCGKPITGGHYATPDGAFCRECWDKVSPADKYTLRLVALGRFANAPTLFPPPPPIHL
jgi:recombinational DNA repair protein (RecF pathway)